MNFIIVYESIHNKQFFLKIRIKYERYSGLFINY